MNKELLQQLGLSLSQAVTYLKLIETGELTPPQVSKLTGESRTNAYMILQKLEDYGLVEKTKSSKKLKYQPLNPVALERLAEEKRAETSKIENQVKHAMPQMLSYFYSFTEKPGIRLLQGVEGIKEIYRDTLRTKRDIYFLRTPHEVDTLGGDYFSLYKQKRAQLGITTYAFTQDTPQARKYAFDDKLNKMVRSWVRPEDYDAPVEVNVYGDKVAFISYGEDVMGAIVQSPAIAESMRQMFKMVARVMK